MILSASGWRKVFAESGDGEDNSPDIGYENALLCALIAETFAEYIKGRRGEKASVVVGMDSRPTGNQIADAVLRVLSAMDIAVHYIGIASAPEIMAYARSLDGFIYISASHNPIGYNGIKFGLNDGGVLPADVESMLAENFKKKCAMEDAEEYAEELLSKASDGDLTLIFTLGDRYKKDSLWAYETFIRTVISGTTDGRTQDQFFSDLKASMKDSPIAIVADMNGSARCASIDSRFMEDLGIEFLPFNNEAGKIHHAIIPEPENLVFCADVMDDLRKDGNENVLLGYMPDCDGDRGNIVYWDQKKQKAIPLPAQVVFALSVLSESAFEIWQQTNMPRKGLLWKAISHYGKHAVAVNGPTSMRIDEICSSFGREVFRAEVGEANVVNLAREKRDEGYQVRIFGEGSNGGNITYPSAVRDPLATVFALVKLLVITDKVN